MADVLELASLDARVRRQIVENLRALIEGVSDGSVAVHMSNSRTLELRAGKTLALFFDIEG